MVDVKNIIYVSDFFIENNLGGAEICDEVIIRKLSAYNFNIKKILSKNLTISLLTSNKDAFFIISNFSMIHSSVLQELTEKKYSYIIYEHDHKYVIDRNPAAYKDYLVPKDKIINYEFYKNAVNVVAQSNFHKEIIEKNLGLANIITFATNFWFDEHYSFMEEMAKRDKFELVSIMDSPIWHKNTNGSVETCKKLNKPFILIKDNNYMSFLEKIGSYSTFMFLPKTPETFSRTCAEARMMNVQVIGNNNIGCLKEEWFKNYKGINLIEFLKNSNNLAIQSINKLIGK